jgi:hypothetical protein
MKAMLDGAPKTPANLETLRRLRAAAQAAKTIEKAKAGK